MIEDLKSKVLRFLARSHTTGPALSSAIDVCRRASAHGWKITLCLWERPYDTPALVAFQYARALNAIAELNADCRLSIKLTALHYSSTLFSDVVWHAKALDIPLLIDAQHPESAPRSLALLEYGLQRYRNIGYTLPARWRRSVIDAEKILDMQIPVRIVKGQWNDPLNLHTNVRRRYLNLVDMFAGSKNHVSIATHDEKLACEAVKILSESSTPYEIEQMTGLPWLDAHAIGRENIERRLYIPYGYPSMPYNLSFAIERPKIFWWIIRDSFLSTSEKIRELGSSLEENDKPQTQTGFQSSIGTHSFEVSKQKEAENNKPVENSLRGRQQHGEGTPFITSL